MILARAALLLGGAAMISVATAAEEEQEPDMAFLEYLGMWEETDEEWELFDEASDEPSDDAAIAENEERSEPVPKGKESQELEDES